MMREVGAVAGINANFYDPSTNIPIGFLLDDGVVLNAPFSDRATLAIEFFGRFHFLNPKIALSLKTPEGGVHIQGVNRPAYDHGLFFYTPEFGRPQLVSQNAQILAIQQGRVIWKGSGRLPDYLVATDISWLVATGNAQSLIGNLFLADAVSLTYSMTPERFFIRDALQAGPMLLRAGKITLLRPEGFRPEFVTMKAARSALGVTAAGEVVLIVVTKGNGSIGMGLDEVAEFLRTLGVTEAMALDGGGSSSLAFQQGARLRNVGGTRAIPVALVFLPH
jgi:hypothetical protein